MNRDIFFEGRIYVGCDNRTPIDKYFKEYISTLTNYEVKGKHNFINGQHVTGLFELKKQIYVPQHDEWINCNDGEYYFNYDKYKRVVAIALPTESVDKTDFPL